MPQRDPPKPRVFTTPIWLPIAALAAAGYAGWLMPGTHAARSSVLNASVALAGIFAFQIAWNIVWISTRHYTREHLAQFDLELAYWRWADRATADVAECLASARRYTRCPQVTAGIDDALAALSPVQAGRSLGHSDIAAILLSLLKLHAARVQPPRASAEADYGPVLPVHLCLLMALTTGLVWIADAGGVLSAEAPWLRVGIAALLAHTSVMVVLSRRSTITHYRAQQGFRTALWLTDSAAPGTDRVFEALYELGDVFVLVVDGEVASLPPSVLDYERKKPAHCRVTSYERCTQALQGAMPHTDLLVVLGGNRARLPVPDYCPLPRGRKLFVLDRRDERAPDGYTGVFSTELDAVALRGRFCKDALADPGFSYGGTRYEYANDSRYYNIGFCLLYIGAALMFLEHWRWLGALCVTTGCFISFPKFLGAARRRSRSPFFRKPRVPMLSGMLANLWGVGFCAWLTGAYVCYVTVSATPWLHVDQLSIGAIPKVVISASLYWLSTSMLTPGILRAIKWCVDWNFRIVLFRRNGPEWAHLHKAAVMPVCGAYGQVICISDENLSVDEFFPRRRLPRRWAGVNGVGELMAEPSHEVLSEYLYTMHVLETHEAWEARVERELAAADFAVFDWTGDISEAMRWELRAAMARLPTERLLMFCGIENHATVRRHLAESRANMRCIPVSRDVIQSRFHVRKWLRQLLPTLEPGPRRDSPAPSGGAGQAFEPGPSC